MDYSIPLPVRIWWPWDQPAARVYFKRIFSIDRAVSAVLYVSASGPYSAWLDGAALAVPDTGLPSWRRMHAIPIDLGAGSHALAIEAQPGDHGQPFLLACLDWDEGGVSHRVPTDASWLAHTGPTAGWQADQDTAGWRGAWAFDGIWAEPWGMPCDAPLDFCRLGTGWQEVACRPLQRLAGVFGGLATQGASLRLLPGGALVMQPAWPHALRPPPVENTRPRLEWYRTREAHSLAMNTWLDLFEPRAPHVVLDAGEEVFARLKLRVRGGGPALLAITTGESLNEVQRYARRVTDIVELRDGESFTTAPTGFRYAKVMALSAKPGGQGVELDPVEAQEITYPTPARGSFRCPDGVLNEVWTLSERTARLCMQSEVWDGIKRDQLPWMGDLYTEALAIYHLFGDQRLVERTLEALAEIGPGQARRLEDQVYPGLVSIWKSGGSSHPGAGSGDINGIPSYTLWWILGLSDYWTYTGDVGLPRRVSAELVAALEHVCAWVEADGIWRFHGGWDFIDWSPVPRAEREQFCHLLACQALRAGADLLAGLGQDVARFRATQAEMARAARQAWWRAGQPLGVSHQVNAMAIRSGVLDPAESAALFASALASDPEYPMTYWHRYLDLEAAACVGEVDWGLAAIRKHWGLSLQLGLTTLWEAFDPAWIGPDPHAVSMVGGEYARYGGYETSLCHGWSAGPAIWLHQAILGVRPAAPGFTAVDFRPCLGDLAWAEGEVPTPRGPISVSLRKVENGKPVAVVRHPGGIALRISDALKAAWQIDLIQA